MCWVPSTLEINPPYAILAPARTREGANALLMDVGCVAQAVQQHAFSVRLLADADRWAGWVGCPVDRGMRLDGMECWQCGRQVRQGAKLCIYCGADLTHNGGAFEPESPAQRGSSYVENESEELPRPGRGSSRGGSRAVPRDPLD